MVKRVFSFLYKETSALHRAAYLLGFFAILSQILAFLRDRLLAHIFGASHSLDLYYAAFRIPDFIFVTVASMVSLSVLVPFIVEKDRQSKEEVKEFVNNVFSFFSIIIILTCGLAFVLIPVFSGLLFKGFSGDSLTEVVLVTRILLISPIALGFSNLFGSLTQAYNRFTIYAFAPLLYNAGIIIGIAALGPSFGIRGVAIGVAIGACLHMLVQIPFVVSIGLFPKLDLRFKFAPIRKVAELSLPRTLTLSTNHIATIFLVSMASTMTAGSISIYSLSLNLQSVPLSIIGVSYSLAAFPTLSRHFADKNLKAFVRQMSTTARHIIFWSLPITALFIVLRAQIVRVLLGSGQFDWNDTRLTAASLALFTLSAVFQCLMLLFMRAFYSAGHTKKPLWINVISMIVLIGCTYGLIEIFNNYLGFRLFISALLKVEDLPGTAVLMLPLGYSIGTILNGIIHWIGFEKDFPGFSREVGRTMFEAFSASVIIGVMTYSGLVVFEPLFNTNSLIGIFLQAFCAGMLGIVFGVMILYLLKSKELSEGWKAIHGKIWKTKVIATDPEIV